MAVKGRENPAGGLDADNEHGIGFVDAFDDLGKGFAARHFIDVLDRFDFTLHRTVKRVAAVAFKAKGCNPVGDQPGRRHFTAQALFDVVEVLITQRAQEPPDRNPGG